MSLNKHWKYETGEDLVLNQLKGLVWSNPYIKLIPSEKVIFNPHSNSESKITLISGGGAGHEPLHAGYVGTNLLDAAVSGSIFASPSTKQILTAIKTKSNKEKGTIVIVKNYTGDVLHFGLAVERAKNEGYKIEIVLVGDDVAVGKEQNKMVGRRGLAGTAIIHKILGAAVQDENVSLKDIANLGHLINDNLVTLSASLDRTSVPGKSENEVTTIFNEKNEIELGLGIHNEPGTKIKPIPNIDELIKKMLIQLISSEDKDYHYVEFDPDDDYIVVINNIGGTSTFELNLITEHVLRNLPFKRKPKRVLISDFVTSFNSPGFSITLLNLTNINKANNLYNQEDIIKYLDEPTNAPGWKPKSYDSKLWEKSSENHIDSPMDHQELLTSNLRIDGEKFKKNLINALNNLLEYEPKITHYDTLVGDGDCGETLASGANSILKAFKENKEFQNNLNDPVASLSIITELIEDNMGGTSGGLYAIFLTSLVQYLNKSNQIDLNTISDSLYQALHEGLFKYTKARVGGRTLIDTLQPFIDTLHETKDLNKALEAAEKGCEKTKNLHASFGRSSYVNEEDFKVEGGIPDPGAVGVLALIKGFLKDYED
ncbi:DAK2 [Candida pseudojiufengensis]|uniref:DAK2 n=1 Tax=Candida pseudojiufengensis TaxID=497109 RepID=UPI00222581AF|nr:DAK2 [Candida pseudojiufengensis]KAI5961428.1 DAK2 [Candida pseudojiufengensis]